MNFTVGQFNIGERDCLGSQAEVRMRGSLYRLGAGPRAAYTSSAWWVCCLPASWGLTMGAQWGEGFGRRTFISIAGGEPLG